MVKWCNMPSLLSVNSRARPNKDSNLSRSLRLSMPCLGSFPRHLINKILVLVRCSSSIIYRSSSNIIPSSSASNGPRPMVCSSNGGPTHHSSRVRHISSRLSSINRALIRVSTAKDNSNIMGRTSAMGKVVSESILAAVFWVHSVAA